MIFRTLLCAILLLQTVFLQAQNDSIITKESSVSEVTVTSSASTRRLGGAVNGVMIGRQELFKAACCNLGESFTTNPSVDVSYSDAATGAKQIRLLGLSGTYVQMLTEQMAAFKGNALPYSLDYVPGPWMQSIQVSKGASTVKNGYESITGQIDIEYLKPNNTEQVNANVYGDTKSRFEANADANIHVNDRLSTIVLAHGEKTFGHHDDNDDGFLDQPRREQFNLQNRWKLVTDNYIMHAGISALKDKREGGELHDSNPYLITTDADRYEAYMKHAFILNAERQENIALMANASLHMQDATYGQRQYGSNEKMVQAQLMYEINFSDMHQLSAGSSLYHYYNNQTLSYYDMPPRFNEEETTAGIYAQYTLNLGSQLTVMAGLRADHSNLWNWFLTPRLHLKYAPSDVVTVRASAGKGYRTPHFFAENHFLMASGRLLSVDPLKQEEAWNYGISTAWNIPLLGKVLKLNAEYYYTHFLQQMVIDYCENNYSFVSSPYSSHQLSVYNLDHRHSYSHTIQIDASYPVINGMTLTAAWRWNDVKCSYYEGLLERPLTSRYKALLSASYAPGLALWHFDATLQLNGGGRIVGNERFHSYEQLQAQITRDFPHFSVYIGGENLTDVRQKNPVRGYNNPWGPDFDATLVWGPVHGPLFYAGLRIHLERI